MKTTDSEQGVFSPWIPAEQLERVYRVMRSELTEKQRRAVEDHYLHGMRLTDMAACYGVSKSTVCRTLRRGVDRLRRFLQY